MRHRKHSNQLGVKKEHRGAFSQSIYSSSYARAYQDDIEEGQSASPFLEKVITLAKNGSLHSRRIAFPLARHDAVHGLFDDKVEQFRDREGGYTRIYKLGTRRGDAAEMADRIDRR